MKIRHEGNYQARRAAAYPAVEEQMDMLWHAMAEGLMPKIEPFFSTLASVKQTYPKPDKTRFPG